MTVRFILILSIAVVAVSSAGILETLLSWERQQDETETRRFTTPQSKCLCQTSGCLCCVDLNLTSTIDLGGPACINIKQKEQNVSLNLSYGDNPVHNATIMIESAANKPTCMNLLSDLAQLCAKFTSITRSPDQGHDGCLVLEPALMKTPQATYRFGCFNFNQGIRQIQLSTIAETPVPAAEEEHEEEEEEEEEGVINTDELIAAVSASAEQGIALFSQWLGLNLNPKLNLSTPTTTTKKRESVPIEETSRTEITKSNATSRTARRLINDEANIEKSEERLKRLLSAQDNISKESARIGQTNGAETTFIYTGSAVDPIARKMNKDWKEPSLEDNAPLSTVAVPRGSQRGGRAYNINLHINEV